MTHFQYLARAGGLVLLLSLLGCPSTPKKKSSKLIPAAKPPRRKIKQARRPSPPGAFPSLVSRETFARGFGVPDNSRPAKPPKIGEARTNEQKPRQMITPVGPKQVRPERQRPRDLPKTDKRDAPRGGGQSGAQQLIVAQLTKAWKLKPGGRHELAQLLNYLLFIDRPIDADRLIKEGALRGYKGKHFELNLALARLDRRLGRSLEAYNRLMQVLRTEKNLLPLSISKALFVASVVKTYGKQVARSSNQFNPRDWFRIYVEVENFVLSDAGKEQYNARFKVSLSIYSAGGEKMQWDQKSEWVRPLLAKDSFRSYLRDIKLSVKGHFPTHIPAGRYELRIGLEDLNKQENKRTVKNLPFVIRSH